MAISIKKRNWAQAVLVSATQTASTTAPAVDGFAGVDNLVLQLAVTAASGTTPNMVVVIEDSIDNTNWNTIATFTAATGVTAQAIRVAGPFGNSIRARSTITGTTPSLTYSVIAQAEGRY